jgi:hypothetical protein
MEIDEDSFILATKKNATTNYQYSDRQQEFNHQIKMKMLKMMMLMMRRRRMRITRMKVDNRKVKDKKKIAQMKMTMKKHQDHQDPD